LFLQVSHVEVFEASLLCFAETDSIDDRGMIQSVADDCVFRSENGLEETCVGIESAGEEDAVFELVVLSYDFFKLFVDILGATYEAD
jgi:hypothetical protein